MKDLQRKGEISIYYFITLRDFLFTDYCLLVSVLLLGCLRIHSRCPIVKEQVNTKIKVNSFRALKFRSKKALGLTALSLMASI